MHTHTYLTDTAAHASSHKALQQRALGKARAVRVRLVWGYSFFVRQRGANPQQVIHSNNHTIVQYIDLHACDYNRVRTVPPSDY